MHLIRAAPGAEEETEPPGEPQEPPWPDPPTEPAPEPWPEPALPAAEPPGEPRERPW